MRHMTILLSTSPLLLSILSWPAAATDEALLQVLLNNKLITQEQYDAIRKAQAAKVPAPTPTAAADAAADRPLPTQEQGLLDVLLANGAISQQQYAALQVKNADDKAKKKDEAKVTLKDGLKVKSQDGDFSAQLNAYVQMDAAFYGNQGPTDFSDGTELRRTRLTLSGTAFKDWDYKVEADFAGTTQKTGTTNSVTVTDAYMRYNGLKPFSFTAGNFKVPFSLEAVSSGKYLTFMERALPFAFLNLRLLGGMVAANGDNWTAAAGLFGDSVTTQNTDDEGKAVAGRFTFAPIYRKDRVLHLGASGQWRVPGDNPDGNKQETIRFRSKPESNIISDNLFECSTVTADNSKSTDANIKANCVPGKFGGRSGLGRSSGRLVDTGNIAGNVNYYTLAGFEAAGVYGPFSLQGEYIRTDVNRDSGGNLVFDGYYVYGSLFLTDDTRDYKADKGIFDIIQPNKPFKLRSDGWGAWEIALRYSGLDLTDKNVNGGRENDLTVGLNWYPNSYFRLMANYLTVLSVDGGPHNGEDIDLFAVRAQVAY